MLECSKGELCFQPRELNKIHQTRDTLKYSQLYNLYRVSIKLGMRMVSGSKKNNTPNKKGKMVLAKDSKQLALAIAVILIFLGNSIYMVVKYIQEQNPAPATTQMQSNQELPSENPNAGPAAASNGATDGTSVTPSQQSQDPNLPVGSDKIAKTDQPSPLQAAPAQPIGGVNPLIPVLIVVLLLALGYGIYEYLKRSGLLEKSFTKSGMARVGKKKKGGKEELALAKDPKQLAIAIAVVLIFIGNSIYMIVKYVQEQNPQPMTAQNPQNMTPEQQLAQQQQQNLESLSQGGETPAGAPNVAQDANDIYSQTMSLKGEESAVNNEAKRSVKDAESDIEIIPRKVIRDRNGKMVKIVVDSSGRSNPFLPAAENFVPSSTSSMPFLPPPPETLQVDSDAGKVMTTTISGILYDKYSPSAIINIEGVDYLVKKGDVVNKYKVLSIGKTQVLVQLGKNVYQAGVGELLSLTNLNFNTIANLNKKFGGNDVSVNVRKKSY